MFLFEDYLSGEKCAFTSKDKLMEFIQEYINWYTKEFKEIPAQEIDFNYQKIPVNVKCFDFLNTKLRDD